MDCFSMDAILSLEAVVNLHGYTRAMLQVTESSLLASRAEAIAGYIRKPFPDPTSIVLALTVPSHF